MAVGDPLSIVGNGRERNLIADKRSDAFMLMQLPNGEIGVAAQTQWEIVVPNGSYLVTLGVGDPIYNASDHHVIRIEGQVVVDFVPTPSTPYTTKSALVLVTDGRMTLDCTPGTDTKLAFFDLAPAAAQFNLQTQLSATATMVWQGAAAITTLAILTGSANLLKNASGAFTLQASLAGNSGVNVYLRTAKFTNRTQLRATPAPVIVPAVTAQVRMRTKLTNAGYVIVKPAAGQFRSQTQIQGLSTILVKPGQAALRQAARLSATAIQVPVFQGVSYLGVQTQLSAVPTLIVFAGGAFNQAARLQSSAPIKVLAYNYGSFNLYTHMQATATYVVAAKAVLTTQTRFGVGNPPTLIKFASGSFTMAGVLRGTGKPFSATYGGRFVLKVTEPATLRTKVYAPNVFVTKVTEA